MFKKALVCFLAAALTLTGINGLKIFSSVSFAAENEKTYHYFYDQLNADAKKIYDVLYDCFKSGQMKDGKTTVNLLEKGAVSQNTLSAYISGDKTLSDNFAAAKDAFDLDCPEAWYVDSSYISLRVCKKNSGEYAVYLGIGRADTYLIQELDAANIASMDKQLTDAVNKIVSGANSVDVSGLSKTDADAKKVKYVHDAVTKSISYKFETECKSGNAPFIRTAYALVTHEGVCEGYSRSVQLILNKLGIPCVLVHGIQNSGSSPEMHMWNEVQIGGKWYALDATWDDPVRLDKDGNRINGDGLGNDGGEMNSYLLVGREVVGQNWLPSGVVSSDGKNFTYPNIEQLSYEGESVYQDSLTGLHVRYTANAEMEDEDAGLFTVDYNGMGVKKSAEQGIYLLVKMYDQHPDGTSNIMTEWYYAAATLALSQGNSYFKDTDTCLKMYTATCEYVEFAITTKRPKGYETWGNAPATNGLANDPDSGYYHGDGSDIIAKTDLIFNPSSDYEAPPYINKQSPAPTGQLDTRQTFLVHIEYDDKLYHPIAAGARGIENQGAAETDDYKKAASEAVQVKLACYQLDRDGNIVPYKLVAKCSVDQNKDYIVDEGIVKWIYDCSENHEHNPETCFVKGLEYQFKASENWSDDLTMYDFQITGLVGSRSNKVPNSWSYIMSTSVCPMAYRSQGIDWALWGRPSLLDNPDDLDLSKLAAQGVDGSKTSLDKLQEQMKIDSMNGRLMLTVEEIGTKDGMSREKYNEVTEAFDKYTNIPDDAVKSSAMYEINFTRLCKMTVVLEGESLRMQLGFPEGYDAKDVEDKKVIFKAYHFTRCSENHPCGHENNKGHKYGDDIVSVEEIPLAVTQYGLVILCSSFSPFEIVALDASKIDADEMTKNHNIIVKTDGNGMILCDGKEAVGANGFISFKEGETHTFKVEAKDGYTTDVVSFGGRQITVGADGTFTLSFKDIAGANDMLNVAFIPVSVKIEEEENGVVTVVPQIVESGSGSETEQQPSHEHKFGDYLHNDTHHYRECGCGEVTDYAEHTFENGVCTVCKAQQASKSDENDDENSNSDSSDNSDNSGDNNTSNSENSNNSGTGSDSGSDDSSSPETGLNGFLAVPLGIIIVILAALAVFVIRQKRSR